jgi:CBS domain-containing protein
MNVNEIMSRDITTVSADTSVMEAASLMCLYRYSGIPVVDGDTLIGLIAERDVLSHLFPKLEDAMESLATINFTEKTKEYSSLMRKPVSDLMAKNLKTVAADMPILKAAVFMANNRFRRIPIADNGKLIGMVSLGDIHKAIFHQSIKLSQAS